MTVLCEEKLLPGVAQWADELTAIRHDFHQHPDLGFDTERTVSKICEYLKAWGITDIDTELVKGSVIATVEGNRPGKTIAVRTDIDALPMNDGSCKPWASQIEGKSHSCGHDGHMTCVLGAARYFSSHRDFPGKVVFVFQAAEETGIGAKTLVDAGLIEKYGIDEIYGGHTEPNLDKGDIGMKAGPLQAAADSVQIIIKGKGTHGGRPHQGIDTIPVASQIVMALQTIVSRKVDPIECAVVSICSISSGRFEAFNVVPHQCTLSGTVRTFLPEIRDMVEAKIEKIVKGIALANDCEVDYKYTRYVASVINSEEQTEAAIDATRKLIGEDHVKIIKPFMSSEDFSEYLAKIPGSIIRVGIRDENHNVSLHNQQFDFNDEVLPLAVSVITNMTLTRLEHLAKVS